MSYVYLITSDNAVKIGIADDPKKRLASLQTGHYNNLRIYCTFHCVDKSKAAQQLAQAGCRK